MKNLRINVKKTVKKTADCCQKLGFRK